MDQQVQAIHYIEDSELPELHRQSEEIKGIFKSKDRKMVEKEIKDTERRLSEIKSDLTKVVTRYGYKCSVLYKSIPEIRASSPAISNRTSGMESKWGYESTQAGGN